MVDIKGKERNFSFFIVLKRGNRFKSEEGEYQVDDNKSGESNRDADGRLDDLDIGFGDFISVAFRKDEIESGDGEANKKKKADEEKGEGEKIKTSFGKNVT